MPVYEDDRKFTLTVFYVSAFEIFGPRFIRQWVVLPLKGINYGFETKKVIWVNGNFTATQFYVDVEAHFNLPRCAGGFLELQFFSEEVRILGTYLANVNRLNNS